MRRGRNIAHSASHARSRCRRAFLLLAVGALVACVPLAASVGAESSADEHASHHGGAPGDSGKAASQGEHGGMGEMMEMHGEPRRAFYPSLMQLPNLSPEERSRLEHEAERRIRWAQDSMASAVHRLEEAKRSENLAEMSEAARALDEASARLRSGLSARLALSEPTAPRDVALSWFKREMRLSADPQLGDARLGVFHLAVMVLLSLFTLGALVLYFLRMRRASALVAALISGHGPDSATPQGRGGDGSPPQASSPPKRANEGKPTAGGTADLPKASSPLRKWSGSLRVARIFSETRNVKTFRLASISGGPLPFTYEPGQFLVLSVLVEGKIVRRSYTIASSPTQAHYCEITVKREDQGVVSEYLHGRLKEGETLEVSAPNGKFTFTGQEAESVVLIGGGVGITPLMSAVRYLTDIEWGGQIFLLVCAHSPRDLIFHEELSYLRARHPNLDLFELVSDARGEAWLGPTGRFTPELLASSVPDLTARRVHLCGPPSMMAALTKMLLELGVPSGQILMEAFGPVIRPAARRAAETGCDCTRCESYRAEATHDGRAQPLLGSSSEATSPTMEAEAAAATVSFERSRKTATLPPDDSILDVADDVGVEIESSCRIGVCGSCKIRLLSGAVTMECEDGLEADAKAQGFILACQAKSTADVAVDA